jgi:hypothetical protein
VLRLRLYPTRRQRAAQRRLGCRVWGEPQLVKGHTSKAVRLHADEQSLKQANLEPVSSQSQARNLGSRCELPPDVCWLPTGADAAAGGTASRAPAALFCSASGLPLGGAAAPAARSPPKKLSAASPTLEAFDAKCEIDSTARSTATCLRSPLKTPPISINASARKSVVRALACRENSRF